MSLEQRKQLITWINEARANGARLESSCATIEIDSDTYRRWHKHGQVVADQRDSAERPEPKHKLKQEERELILLTCDLPEFKSLPPSQIVPALADQGVYLASESSFYRVLHDALKQHERGRAKPRSKRAKPNEFVATGPNQCWCWDVTFLKSPVKGLFYYLSLVSR